MFQMSLQFPCLKGGLLPQRSQIASHSHRYSWQRLAQVVSNHLPPKGPSLVAFPPNSSHPRHRLSCLISGDGLFGGVVILADGELEGKEMNSRLAGSPLSHCIYVKFSFRNARALENHLGEVAYKAEYTPYREMNMPQKLQSFRSQELR
jgi:hypothetical protein